MLPDFYRPDHARDAGYDPDPQALFEAAAPWRRAHAIRPAGEDRKNVHLLLIDLQRDFCFPSGSLYVGGRSGQGALDDNGRTAEFIYRNLKHLTNVTATMDSHLAFQIFSPSFWIDSAGEALKPHRTIVLEDVHRGRVRPNPEVAAWLCQGDTSWLQNQVEHYCRELERGGKYTLYLWPPHCLLGSTGHALAGVVHEARLFHSYVRGTQSWTEAKGENPLTENYSVLSAEVLTHADGSALARRNTSLTQRLLSADAIIVAGQAASHCVKSSVEDLLGAIQKQDAKLAKKVYLLEDCMSSVVVPGVSDFTPQAEDALERFAEAGMHRVRSSSPMESWPDFR